MVEDDIVLLQGLSTADPCFLMMHVIVIPYAQKPGGQETVCV